MKITAKRFKDWWTMLPEGEGVTLGRTCEELEVESGVGRRTTSSLLVRQVQRGHAVKAKTPGAPSVYTKVGKQESKPQESRPQEPSILDYVQVGRSIVTVIDGLKADLEDMAAKLRKANRDWGQAVEEKKHIEELYRQAQERILEMGRQKGNGKGLSLHALYEFHAGLREGGA